MPQMQPGFLMMTRRLAMVLTLGISVAAAGVGAAQAQAVTFAPRGDFDLLIRQSLTQAPAATTRTPKSSPGELDATYRLERYHQGWMRMDGMLDANGSKLKDATAGESGYILVNNEKKLGFNVTGSGAQQKAEKLPMGGGADIASQYQPKVTGETQTVAGEKCNVMTVDIGGTVVKTCVTPDGLTLRMEMQVGPNHILHEAVKLNWRAQNAADFVPPAVP